MNKFLLSALIAVSSLIGISSAQATTQVSDTARFAYTCQLRGHIHGNSVAVIVGGEYLSGTGYLTCDNAVTGKRSRIPIAMSLVGAGIGFDFTVIRSVQIFSAGFGIDNPRAFMGEFGIGATAGAELGRAGLAFDLAFEVKNRAGLDVEVGLQGQNAAGLGAHLYGMTFKVARR